MSVITEYRLYYCTVRCKPALNKVLCILAVVCTRNNAQWRKCLNVFECVTNEINFLVVGNVTVEGHKHVQACDC